MSYPLIRRIFPVTRRRRIRERLLNERISTRDLILRRKERPLSVRNP
jgi:hypothetical protein